LHNLLDNCCAANDKEYQMKAMEALGMAYQRYRLKLFIVLILHKYVNEPLLFIIKC